MSAPSHYTINVSRYVRQADERFGKRYVHLFDTGTSLQSEPHASQAMREIVARFPAPEFKVDMTHWQCSGRTVDINA